MTTRAFDGPTIPLAVVPAYVPRRALPTEPSPLDDLLDALDDLADDLDQKSADAGGPDRSLLGRVYAECATDLRRTLQENQP